jgi:high-affinity nickel permease
VTCNYDGAQTKRVKWQKYFFHANGVSRVIIIVIKVLNWIILLILSSSFQISAQSPEDLGKARDQLVERGMWREALESYVKSLMQV